MEVFVILMGMWIITVSICIHFAYKSIKILKEIQKDIEKLKILGKSPLLPRRIWEITKNTKIKN